MVLVGHAADMDGCEFAVPRYSETRELVFDGEVLSVCMKKLAGRYRRVETGIEYRKTSGEDSRATNVTVVV